MTYQETVAADVASRYGCAVSPSCVQLLPPATVLISGGLDALSQNFHSKPITEAKSPKPRGSMANVGKRAHERKLAMLAKWGDKLRAAVTQGSYEAAACELGLNKQTVRNYCIALGIVSPKSRVGA